MFEQGVKDGEQLAHRRSAGDLGRFARCKQTAIEDSTVEYTPGRQSEDRECWYINMGIVTRQYLDPQRMVMNVR